MSKILPMKYPKDSKLSVLGTPLHECSCNPMTGWFRNGSCQTSEQDLGNHTICCVVTDEFLEFSKERGNDLSTARPEMEFPGLKHGDSWCLCLARWVEAMEAQKAPLLKLESTHISVLNYVDLEVLKQYQFLN